MFAHSPREGLFLKTHVNPTFNLLLYCVNPPTYTLACVVFPSTSVWSDMCHAIGYVCADRVTAVCLPGHSTVCDDESDDGLPNTYDYDDSFIDDDGMNSSASSGDDSDEDWQHPGNDGGGEESEEDIKELAKEASEFVANPKLQRR